MAKVYGQEMKVTHGEKVTVHRQWFSQNLDKANEMAEIARGIIPPENTSVEFSPLEADVLICTPGIYRTDKNERVEITAAGEVRVCGHMLKSNGKRNPYTHFWIVNGEPSNITAKPARPIVDCDLMYLEPVSGPALTPTRT